jgi:hypothetical protein
MKTLNRLGYVCLMLLLCLQSVSPALAMSATLAAFPKQMYRACVDTHSCPINHSDPTGENPWTPLTTNLIYGTPGAQIDPTVTQMFPGFSLDKIYNKLEHGILTDGTGHPQVTPDTSDGASSINGLRVPTSNFTNGIKSVLQDPETIIEILPGFATVGDADSLAQYVAPLQTIMADRSEMKKLGYTLNDFNNLVIHESDHGAESFGTLPSASETLNLVTVPVDTINDPSSHPAGTFDTVETFFPSS